MIVMITYAVISFLLDGFISNYMNVGIIEPSYFRTIFSVISLVIMLYFFEDNKKYFYILIVIGILFDIVYTNTFLLNIFLFYVIYFILSKIDNFLSDNLFMVCIKSYLAIFLYHTLSYLILMIAEYQYYSIKLLWDILLHSIISTVIYSVFSYLIIKKIFYKRYDRKIR